MKKEIDISPAQLGGKKNASTVDHIYTIKEIAKISKNGEQPLYVTFIDIKKAYDKAWLDGIMYILYKNGLKSRIWRTVRRLNSNLKAVVRTKFGKTEEFAINNSIRQGGVLAVTLFAVLMDEIAKEIEKARLGVQVGGKKIGCLLWVDDAVLMSNTKEEHQKILNIVHKVGSMYHLEFSEEKTQSMRIPYKVEKTKENNNLDSWITTEPLKLGNITLKTTDNYKYLGETLNKKMEATNHINTIIGKTEAAYQTIQYIIKDEYFKNIPMESAWKLLEACLIPIILYACESASYSKKEIEELTKLYDRYIRRIIKTPQTTPRESLYLETGIIDIRTLIEKRQIRYRDKLEKNESWIIKSIKETDFEGSWINNSDKLIETWGITKEEIGNKRQINHKAKDKMIETLVREGSQKSKIKHLMEFKESTSRLKRELYIDKLSRIEASAIFRTKTRMLFIKDNYRNGQQELQCRACKNKVETQNHVLRECYILHNNNQQTMITDEELKEDLDILALKKQRGKK